MIDRDELTRELNEAAQRFESLLRSLTLQEMSAAVPGLTWNVGEVAAHVLTVIRRGLHDFRRSSTPAGTTELNALCLVETSERDPQVLADLFAADAATVINKVFPRIPDDLQFPFHAGTTTTIHHAMGIVLGEILIHGHDIAHAAGRTWVIKPRSAELIWLGGVGVMYGWLKTGLEAVRETYQVCLGDVVTWLRVTDGKLEVHFEPIEPVDDVIQADPLDLLMTLPYGRKVSADPVLQRLASRFEAL
jgi:hypothetical protein